MYRYAYMFFNFSWSIEENNNFFVATAIKTRSQFVDKIYYEDVF